MKLLTIALTIFMASFKLVVAGFKTDQKKYARVRVAYSEKECGIKSILNSKSISLDKLNVYIRAFKDEGVIELWGKNKSDPEFILIREYDVCCASGILGPKRKSGDLQVPEGFYYIDRFNPKSNFYLSLGINYPNKSDRILGEDGNLGGDIFIHGDCVTIGCLPITDDKIKELYVFCVEARNNGQEKIPVTIFPFELTDEKLGQSVLMNKPSQKDINLWSDLKQGYDYFNVNKRLPNVYFLLNGRHKVI